jgi:proline dehydrogenase
VSTFARLVLAATEARLVRNTITGTRAGRALAHRFVAGDTLDQAVAVTRQLNHASLMVSLDHLGEEVLQAAAASAAEATYLACLRRAVDEELHANISIKLTQLGLAIDQAMAAESLHRLAAAAASLGSTVTIDMEDSRYTQATVDLYASAQAEHGNLGIALQSYLHRSADDLERLLPLGGHIRLCKGAYAEAADIAYQERVDVDAAFCALLERLMGEEKVRPAIATHDSRLINLSRRLAQSRTGNFEFQMLYGVRPNLQRELEAAGYEVRVYLPFGSEWYPYLTRRLAERPANLGFFLRALRGG